MAVSCGVLTVAQSSWLLSSRLSEVEYDSAVLHRCYFDPGERYDSGYRHHCDSVSMKMLALSSGPAPVDPLEAH